MLRGEIGSGRRHREASGGAPRKLGRGYVAMRQGCLWVWVVAVPLQDLPRGRGWALASPPPRCPVRPRCVWQTRCPRCGPVPSARGRQADAPAQRPECTSKGPSGTRRLCPDLGAAASVPRQDRWGREHVPFCGLRGRRVSARKAPRRSGRGAEGCRVAGWPDLAHAGERSKQSCGLSDRYALFGFFH